MSRRQRTGVGKRPPAQGGLTLLELAVVLLVLVGLAGMLLPHLGGTGERAACTTTDATLATARDAITGGARSGFYDDMLPHRLPDDNGNGRHKLHYLMERGSNPPYDPVTRVGWNGPYLQGGLRAAPAALHASFTNPAYGEPVAAGDSMVVDGYRNHLNPVVIQVPTDDGDGDDCADLDASYDRTHCARLVSAGPDGALDTLLADADASARGDDRVLFLRIADPGHNRPCE
jgi:type II secretory pathway pseudopilin PulG